MLDTSNPQLDAPPPYGESITLAAAQRALAAAEAKAAEHDWPVAIVIADVHGGLLAAIKRDGTQHSAMGIATGKAQTAVNFRRPTRMFQDGIAQGGEGLRFLAVPGVTPLEGGFPILLDGKVIGGIGVSGVLSTQDTQVALAGLAALG